MAGNPDVIRIAISGRRRRVSAASSNPAHSPGHQNVSEQEVNLWILLQSGNRLRARAGRAGRIAKSLDKLRRKISQFFVVLHDQYFAESSLGGLMPRPPLR